MGPLRAREWGSQSIIMASRNRSRVGARGLTVIGGASLPAGEAPYPPNPLSPVFGGKGEPERRMKREEDGERRHLSSVCDSPSDSPFPPKRGVRLFCRVDIEFSGPCALAPLRFLRIRIEKPQGRKGRKDGRNVAAKEPHPSG